MAHQLFEGGGAAQVAAGFFLGVGEPKISPFLMSIRPMCTPAGWQGGELTPRRRSCARPISCFQPLAGAHSQQRGMAALLQARCRATDVPLPTYGRNDRHSANAGAVPSFPGPPRRARPPHPETPSGRHPPPPRRLPPPSGTIREQRRHESTWPRISSAARPRTLSTPGRLRRPRGGRIVSISRGLPGHRQRPSAAVRVSPNRNLGAQRHSCPR
jgi:hypothetical protein